MFQAFDVESVGEQRHNVVVVKSERGPLHLVLGVCKGDEQSNRIGFCQFSDLVDVGRSGFDGDGDHSGPVVPRIGENRSLWNIKEIPLMDGERVAFVLDVVSDTLAVNLQTIFRNESIDGFLHHFQPCDGVATVGKPQHVERFPAQRDEDLTLVRRSNAVPVFGQQIVVRCSVPTDLLGLPSVVPKGHVDPNLRSSLNAS